MSALLEDVQVSYLVKNAYAIVIDTYVDCFALDAI